MFRFLSSLQGWTCIDRLKLVSESLASLTQLPARTAYANGRALLNALFTKKKKKKSKQTVILMTKKSSWPPLNDGNVLIG